MVKRAKRANQWKKDEEDNFIRRIWQNHQESFRQLRDIDESVWKVVCCSFGLERFTRMNQRNTADLLGITQRQVHFYKKIGLYFLGYQGQFYPDVARAANSLKRELQKKQKGEKKMEKQKEILLWIRENTGADLGEKLTYFSDAFLQATTRDLMLFPVVEKFMRDMTPAKIASDFNLTESGVEDIIFVSCLLLGWNGQPTNGALKLFEEIKKLQIAQETSAVPLAAVAVETVATPETAPPTAQAVKPKLDITEFYFQLWQDFFDWVLAQESPVIKENGVVFIGGYIEVLKTIVPRRYPKVAPNDIRALYDRWIRLVKVGVVKSIAPIQGKRVYLVLDPNHFEITKSRDSAALREWFGEKAEPRTPGAVVKKVVQKTKPKKSAPEPTKPSLADIFSEATISLPVLREELQKLYGDIDSLEQMLAETKSRAQNLEAFLQLREEEIKLTEKLQIKK